MGNARFRAYPVYVNSRKIAEFNAVNYTLDSGDEQQIGAEGILGISDGVVMMKLEGDAVIPVTGTDFDFKSLFLGKQYCSIIIRADGKRWVWTGRLTSMDYSSSTKNGEAKGKFTFLNAGPPAIN